VGEPGVKAYLRARDAVLRIKERAAADRPASSAPSAYWSEELGHIDYMIEASPLIVRKLRHHAFHITGIRPYDYREKGDGRREHFEARLRALSQIGGDALLVPEAPALGGFGYDIGGRLLNVDTLKFYEVLIGMERAGILADVRAAERPLVCEIGAGWGGFAYQFTTLFPHATYVIVDFPELFLYSATYLGSVFPDARLQFWGESAEPAPDGWREADFIFVPNTLAPLVSSLPLDLTVNMVSFQEMTDAQVRGYARIAAEAGCRRLYSFNRERSPYNVELASVSGAVSERYSLDEIHVLESDYTTAMKKPAKPGRSGGRSELGYRHLSGRLKQPGVCAGPPPTASTAPRVVLGMTLYNRAEYLPEAIASLLSQTCEDFRLVLLDDASTDATERIAREYERRDARVRYFRHPSRQAMVATWREVVDLALRDCPEARYFAWVSDHDLWDSVWLQELVDQLDAHPEAVLAYPVTQRITPGGEAIDKGARLFDTAGIGDRRARWRRFCDEGVGSGDMVYGLMRVDALKRVGVFRTVLRPDRLLIAEMTLQGEIRQVQQPLWFRRMFEETSIARQRQTLVLPGTAPASFAWPPWAQHARVLYREYAKPPDGAMSIARGEWIRMIALYLFTYGWRHFRKSETSHWFARAVSRTLFAKKLAKHYVLHAVYHALIGFRTFRGHARRKIRLGVYHVLVFRHRAGKEIASAALGIWATVRRVVRRVVYRGLVFAHRLGLRGGGEAAP
jgi:glycosyltransferase involved in cell wall biosynthesis